jgi:pilus assembly protein Flp/PilA
MMQARRASRAEDGASSSEYGILVSGIAALIVAMVTLFGGAVSQVFDQSCGTISSHVTGSSCAP